jgi:hypothetical protein
MVGARRNQAGIARRATWAPSGATIGPGGKQGGRGNDARRDGADRRLDARGTHPGGGTKTGGLDSGAVDSWKIPDGSGPPLRLPPEDGENIISGDSLRLDVVPGPGRTREETSTIMVTKQNKSIEAAFATQLVAGTQKHFATVASLTFASDSLTPAQIEAQLQQLATLRNEVENAKAALKAKLATETVQAPSLRTLQRAYVQFVKTTFSKSPDVLADFGIRPNKTKTPLTVEQKAAAAAKSKATRSARGTKGPRQKLEITGDVTGVVVTPATAAKPVVATANGNGTGAPATSAPTAPTPHSG